MNGKPWTLLRSTSWLAASASGALLFSACNVSPNGVTCAEATYDDVGNLAFGIIGTTIDDLGIPIAGAHVFIPGTSIDLFSDANGRFSIAADQLDGLTTVNLWAEADGYPDKVQEVTIPTDRLADAVLVMKPFTTSDVLVAEEGGSVTDGTATVTFEPNSLVYADTGEPVSGEVEISIVTYRPDNVEDMRAAPGKLEGVTIERDENGDPILDENGNPTYRVEAIRTYGMVDVAMYQDGLRLELAEGSPAHVLLENIVEGEHNQAAIDDFYLENQAELGEDWEGPSVPLWHFNYDNANWDRVEGYSWSYSEGSEGGYINLEADVPEFSPANPDLPPVQCSVSIDIVEPVETCVCKNVVHANGIEPVRGADISLMSRAWAYTYLVTTCTQGGVEISNTRVLVNKTKVTALDRAITDAQGNFCGIAIVDGDSTQGHYLEGSVRIDSVKTYWPGELDEEDRQFVDYDGDGDLDDNDDDAIDAENIVGYLGDTHRDTWIRDLLGDKACGGPDEVIEVECINEPVSPEDGSSPE